jgi:carbonic anhydrase
VAGRIGVKNALTDVSDCTFVGCRGTRTSRVRFLYALALAQVKLFPAMSVIDEVLAANEIYSRTHELRRLTPRPERKLAVLTCMDTRLSILTLGLNTGDAHIIRNAGGIVTDDSLRSLLVSHYLLGTEEFMVINHTDCGLMHTNEQDLRMRIQNRAGTAAIAPAFFYAFQNIDENVRHQLQKLRSHPWIPHSLTIRGFVYDVTSGRLREIKDY